MNLQAILPELFLECADGHWPCWLFNRGKLGRLGSEAFDSAEIFRLVRRDPNQAARSERTMKRAKEVCRYNSARSMAPLRPWIGKHQMKYRHGTGREQLRNGIRNFAAQDARMADAAVFDLPAGASHSADQPFHSKKISLWIRRGGGGEKGAIAAAKIDLQRRVAAEDVFENQRRKIVRRKDLRRICYRGRSNGHTE